MVRRGSVLILLLVLTAQAQAQRAPESLLSAKTQIYFRWDGQDPHQASFDKTALGELMKGDTGKLFDYAGEQLSKGLKMLVNFQLFFQGAENKEAKKLKAQLDSALNIWKTLKKNGMILAVEVQSVMPPSVQATMMIPNAGKDSESLFALFGILSHFMGVPIQELKDDDRTLYLLGGEATNCGWWIEGQHAVVTVGTSSVSQVARRMTGGRQARLSTHPLYREVVSFNKFVTAARGFVDFASLLKVGADADKNAAETLKTLGLDGLQSLTFVSGFEGIAERSVIELKTSHRRGILKAIENKPFKLSDVPPLPPDVASWTMSSVNFDALYSGLLRAVSVLSSMWGGPQQDDTGMEKLLNQMLGMDVRKDLIGSLGNHIVQYASPGEGALSFNQTMLIRTKDGGKLEKILQSAFSQLGKVSRGTVSVQTSEYRKVKLMQIAVKEEGFIFSPTFAISDGWLMVSFYPQPVQGAILRVKKQLDAWKPSKKLLASMEKMPKEFTAISVTDPRPGVKQLLSWAPMIAGFAKSTIKEADFDLSRLPNAHEVCKPLFPNVSVITDDGKTVRVVTRASLSLPFEPTSMGVVAISAMSGYFMAWSSEQRWEAGPRAVPAVPVPGGGKRAIPPPPPGAIERPADAPPPPEKDR